MESGARLADRKQFLVAPDRSGPRFDDLARHHAANGRVVVGHFERTETLAAHIAGLGLVARAALVAGQSDNESHTALSTTTLNAQCSMPNAQWPMLNGQCPTRRAPSARRAANLVQSLARPSASAPSPVCPHAR